VCVRLDLNHALIRYNRVGLVQHYMYNSNKKRTYKFVLFFRLKQGLLLLGGEHLGLRHDGPQD
jgi:hypothetical protein